MSTIPPNLLDYQRRALAMRESSYIDFPAHVHLETMARCNAACNFCPYSSLATFVPILHWKEREQRWMIL